MKRGLLVLLLLLTAIACFADEYKDPATNVIYTYDPTGDSAEVKQGEASEDIDNGEHDALLGLPGSPDAKTEIVILDRFTVDGKEYIVDKVSDYAFVHMSNIVSIVIPSSVTFIGEDAFAGCLLLSELVFTNGLKTIGMRAFAGCNSISILSLPEGLETIGFEAFTCCSKLESITLPSSVNRIDPLPFLGCDALRTINSLIENPFAVEDICTPLQQQQIILRVPLGTKSKYKATPGWNQFSTIEEFQPTGEAQEPSYRPFVEDGKVWHYAASNPNDNPEYYKTWERTYWLDGDTVIGNHHCHKLYVNKSEPDYWGALFEDGAQVFHIWPNSETPYLLYDFSCPKGDDVTIWGVKFTILDRFNVQFNGSSYAVLKYCLKEDEIWQSMWIEGVGDLSGLTEYVGSWDPGSYCYKLLSCEVNGEVIFDRKAFQDAVTGCQPLLETYDSSSSPYHGQYFDLQGRRLPSGQALPSRHGVFIRDGKKILR